MFTLRNFESKTLSWWYDQREKLDFQPSYQRKGRLWSSDDKSYLIDSILNGFDMPKIYIADFTFFNSNLNEKKKPFSVVDGKQRFEAIFDFYTDKISLRKDFIFLEEPKLKLAGLTYKDIKNKYPSVASKFENFNLAVISIITDSESLINEMFIRLNSSKPLTGAELRNAMKGEVPKLTRDIIHHIFFANCVRFNTQRGQDSNVATKLLLIEFRGKFVDTKRVHLDKLVEESAIAAETGNKGLRKSYTKIIEILDSMSEVFIEKDPLLATSGFIPVYYWFYKLHGIKQPKDVRPFLIEFEIKRKEVRKMPSSEVESGAAPFVLFNLFSRNINDQTGLQGCYNVLVEAWTSWLVNGHLNAVSDEQLPIGKVKKTPAKRKSTLKK